MNNSLKSFGIASVLLAGACAHKPVAENRVQSPVVNEGGELQILAVADRINNNCGEISSMPAMAPKLGYTAAGDPDAAIFLGVTREQLECFVDAAMDPKNGPKVCMPRAVRDRGESADIMVRCVDRGDLDK